MKFTDYDRAGAGPITTTFDRLTRQHDQLLTALRALDAELRGLHRREPMPLERAVGIAMVLDRIAALLKEHGDA